MTNVFADVADNAQEEVDDDRVGGGFSVKPTDIYEATIKAAYIQKSRGESKSQSMVLLLDVDGQEVRSQQWFMGRDGNVTYKKDGKKFNLVGYNILSSLANIVAGKDLKDLETETKTLKLYDFEARKEVNTECLCYTEFHGEKVAVALQHQIVDKQKKSGDKYVNTGETRDENVVVKFMVPETHQTISELSAFMKDKGTDLKSVISKGQMSKVIEKAPAAGPDSYATKWLEKNKGKPYDRSKGAPAGGSGKSFGDSSNDSSSSESGDDLFG